jgi:hypothetical protein
VIEAQPTAPTTQPATEVAGAEAEDGATGAAPVPQARPADAPSESPQPGDTATAGAPAEDGSPGSAAAGAGGETRTLSAGGGLAAASRDLLNRLPGVAGGGGSQGGSAAADGQMRAMEQRGSRLAKECLDNSNAFQRYDKVSVTFEVKLDPARTRMTLQPNPTVHVGDPLPGWRMAVIENALNECSAFRAFVFSRQGIDSFRFQFTSGKL